MKKLITLLSFFIATSSLVVMQSCKEDEPTPVAPTVTSPSGVAAVQINKAVDVTFSLDIPGGYSSTEIGTVSGGTAAIKSEPASGETTGDVVITFTAGAAEGAGLIPVTILDKNKKIGTGAAAISISVDAPPTLTLNTTTATVPPGGTTKVTATVTAPNGAAQLIVAGAGATPASPITQNGTAAIATEVTVSIPASAVIGSTISVTFQAKDAKNLLSSTSTLTVTVAYPELPAAISTNLTLDASQKYLIKGQVFVKNGATLTIPAGTVLKGERASKGTLIIEPGGKLVCNGTAANPVVFTSDQNPNTRDKGDWGGVIILGNAFVNQSSTPSIEGISPAVNYGNTTSPATNADQNSGSLTYVRIEYAGIELTPNNETNSLTMGGVGSGTTIDYVQASFGGDDGFEWFGGTVNAKHLISYGTWDDDFDTDFGWGGNVQYGLVVRYPFSADQSGSNAFESDNQGNANAIAGKCDGTTNTGCTRGVFSNITVIGPRDYNNGLIRTGESAKSRPRAISANFQHALHIRRRTAISIFNSVFVGYPVGLRIDDQATLDNYNAGVGKLANNIMLAPQTKEVGTTAAELAAVYATNIGTGDAAVVKTYFTTGLANTVSFPTGAAAWSVTPNNPVGSINPYTALGLSNVFWGQDTEAENPVAIDAYPVNPTFAVTTGTLATGAAFADTKITAGGTFFTTTGTFIGAFGGTDWTDTWTNFRPLATNYN